MQSRMQSEAQLKCKAELKEVLEAAMERRKLYQKKTILFVKQVLEAHTPAITGQ